MKIDFHAHAFPGEFFLELGRLYPDIIQLRPQPDDSLVAIWAGTPLPAWNHDDRLAVLEQAHVEMQILSNPPIYNKVDDHSPMLCRMVNDALAASARRDPDHFRAFAHLPFNDIDLALNEMARALDDLGCVGILINSNVGGRYLDDPFFLPFWAEVNRRRVCVFMHPSRSLCYQDGQPDTLLSFPFDTTLAAHKLVRSGLYERFPDIVLVLAHLGGALPFLAHRIDIASDFPGFYAGYTAPSHRPSADMRKLYVDTALGWNRSAFACASALVGLDHIVFGTDCFIPHSPFSDWTCQFLDGLDLSPRDREAIYSGTARRILKL